MFKLSKQSDYALVLMTNLAKLPPESFSGLKELSETHNLPYKFIGQIATKLKHARLLTSKEGSGGGYQLAKAPQEITVDQIVTALEGPLYPTSCLQGNGCRCQASCYHRDMISGISRTLVEAMQGYTLADLLNHSGR
jgi:Rrf2 family protein